VPPTADRSNSRHQANDQRERGLAAFMIGIQPEHDAANRAHEEAHAESRSGQ
jgi:hypothetical protein